MRGKYSIEIYNNKLHYQFEVKRNITIIQGNSATGKTTLINMIADYSFLTEQLRSISLDAGHNYSKRRLDRFFLSNRCITKVKKLMEFVNC